MFGNAQARTINRPVRAEVSSSVDEPPDVLDACYALAHALLGDEQAAAGVVSTVCRASADSRDLLAVTHRLAAEAARAGRPTLLRKEHLPALAQALLQGTDCSPRLDRLRNQLAGLTPSEHVVLVLTYFGGCTTTDAATLTGLPCTTVMSLRVKALQHLRQFS